MSSLNRQWKDQSRLVREGMPTPPWWVVAQVGAAVVAVAGLAYYAMAPASGTGAATASSGLQVPLSGSPQAPADAVPASQDRETNSSTGAENPTSSDAQASEPGASDPGASDSAGGDESRGTVDVSAFILDGPLPVDGATAAVLGPNGGLTNAPVNMLRTARAALVAPFSNEVAQALPTTGPAPQVTGTLTGPAEVQDVIFVGRQGDVYIVSGTVTGTDGADTSAQVRITESGGRYLVVTGE